MNCLICEFPLNRKQLRCCSRKCQAVYFRKLYRGKGNSPYIQIRNENGEREYLHRYVYRTRVRPLKAGEIVHHKDGNKRNNAVENLEAVKDRAEHLKEHNYWRRDRESNYKFDDKEIPF